MAGRYGSYDAIYSDGGYTLTEEDKETIALGRHSPAVSFSRNIGDVQVGRQLFSTAERRFGFGNAETQEADVVCIFQRCSNATCLAQSERGRKGRLDIHIGGCGV